MELKKEEKESVKMLYIIWKSIDFSKFKTSRLMRIWGEFEGKIKFASYKPTPEQFLNTTKNKFGIATIKNPEILELLKIENLKEIRKNTVKLILILRGMIEIEKIEYKKLKDTKQEKKLFKRTCDELLEDFLIAENKDIELSDEINELNIEDEFNKIFRR